MTRPPPPAAYDDDFFAWTQEQAAVLRKMPRGAVGNLVDIEHIAEEIEDLGRRDLREVSSFLELLIAHLIKIDNFPASPDVRHWRVEARVFRRSAADAFSPGMRQRLDIERIWQGGTARARDAVADDDETLSAPAACPFTLDAILAEDFDLDAALKMLVEAR